MRSLNLSGTWSQHLSQGTYDVTSHKFSSECSREESSSKMSHVSLSRCGSFGRSTRTVSAPLWLLAMDHPQTPAHHPSRRLLVVNGFSSTVMEVISFPFPIFSTWRANHRFQTTKGKILKDKEHWAISLDPYYHAAIVKMNANLLVWIKLLFRML